MGLSVRAYARHRKCARATVIRRINNGQLGDGVLADGTIDPVKADRNWKDNVTRIPHPARNGGSTLAEANHRRLVAVIGALTHRVATLEGGLIYRQDVDTWHRQELAHVERVWDPVPAALAPHVADKTPDIVGDVIAAAVHEKLVELGGEPEEENRNNIPINGVSTFEQMTSAQLAIEKANLQTKRVTLMHKRRTGEMLSLALVSRAHIDAVTACRQKFLYASGKLAPMFRGKSVAEAEQILRKEFHECMYNLRIWPTMIGKNPWSDERW